MDLVVENVGSGPAYDIDFQLESDLVLEKDRNRQLSSIGFLKNGVRYLAPKQRLTCFLMSLLGVGDEKLQGDDRLRFVLTVSYRDMLNRKSTENFEIDFAHFVGMMHVGTPPLPTIAKHLEKIAKEISDIGSGWHKPKVVHYTPDDLSKERGIINVARMGRHELVDEVVERGSAKPESHDAPEGAA